MSELWLFLMIIRVSRSLYIMMGRIINAMKRTAAADKSTTEMSLQIQESTKPTTPNIHMIISKASAASLHS